MIEKAKTRKPRQDILPSEKPALDFWEQKSLDSELLDAAGKGNNLQVLQVIRNGAGLDARGDDCVTALHRAASIGHTQTCALLLKEYAKSGRDVKKLITAKTRSEKRTPIYNAAEYGYTDTCILIIEAYKKAGGDAKKLIFSKDRQRMTPMHSAAWNGHVKTCALLLGKYIREGGDINDLLAARDKERKTPLDRATDGATTYERTQTAQFLKFMASLPGAFFESFGECVA
jgi:ankyrin repeat protein